MVQKRELSRRIYQAVIGSKVYISQNNSTNISCRLCRYFSIVESIQYFAFCDDFGPMNMASIARFIDLLDSEILSYPSHTIVFCVESGRRALSNAVFLLGTYMMFKLEMSATQISNKFSWLDETMIENFRDATFASADFELTLLDCWRGLERGKSLGWIGLPDKDSSVWGKINVQEYEHYDHPDQADLHEVVPGKFVAFKGPKDLGSRTYFDDKKGNRHYSPLHYIPIFRNYGVTSVIRLNEVLYDSRTFSANGFTHHHLEFDDCTSPSTPIVEQFFRIVDSTPGSVAIHCKAGLGRTGTLIALYLMRSHGFTAREAIGWLRIMRPGSVIGEQQHYLCEVERSVEEMLQNQREALQRTPPLRKPKIVSCVALAAQVEKGMERRSTARAMSSFKKTSTIALPAIPRAK